METIVLRSESGKSLSDFEGVIESVEFESDGERRQYHTIINPTSVKVGGATQRIHEWVPMSPKALENSVPIGSVMDRYLMQIELCVPEIKKKETLKEAFALLIDKKFRFARLKLGKDYNNQPAKEYIVPVQLLVAK